ncbi:hypothetical protein ABIB94_007942 [Bradyrhizobium sp. JR7.2]
MVNTCKLWRTSLVCKTDAGQVLVSHYIMLGAQ